MRYNRLPSLLIKFPNNKFNINCLPVTLSRSPPPPLPGGYKVGEKLYFIGASQTFESGNRLVHGEQGEVMGPETGANESKLLIKFPNNKGNIACTLDSLSRSPPPPLPGATRSARSSITSEQAIRSRAATASCTARGEVMGPGPGDASRGANETVGDVKVAGPAATRLARSSITSD